MQQPDVANNAQTTDKMLGGVTGKGFMPGQSGNPSGRPKKRRLSEYYEELIDKPLPEELRKGLRLEAGATYGEAIALRLARAAIKGKPEAAREFGDRTEGKARQPVEVSGVPIDYAEMVASIRRRKAELAEKRRQEATAGKTEDPVP